MEQITTSTENSVELSEVIEATPITVEEVAPLAEVAAVEEVAPLAEVAPVEEVAPLAEVASVEEVAPLAEVAPVEEVAPLAEVTVEIVTQIAEVIVNTVEEVAPLAEVAPVEVVTQIAEVAAVEVVTQITEVIVNTVEEVIPLAEVIVNTVEEANSLTATQKEALDIVFNDVTSTVEHIMIDADVPVQVKIMQMISPIMKTVQNVSALKLALTGADKKAVALECGRKCIKMMLKDHLDMLMLYNTIAEPALETMLDLSRTLKPILKELEKKEPSADCFMALFSACMNVKSK